MAEAPPPLRVQISGTDLHHERCEPTTQPSGAAVGDTLRGLARRFPRNRITLKSPFKSQPSLMLDYKKAIGAISRFSEKRLEALSVGGEYRGPCHQLTGVMRGVAADVEGPRQFAEIYQLTYASEAWAERIACNAVLAIEGQPPAVFFEGRFVYVVVGRFRYSTFHRRVSQLFAESFSSSCEDGSDLPDQTTPHLEGRGPDGDFS